MAYFKRFADAQLASWRDDSQRKPLLVRGARQVGKSSAVRELGKSFEYFAELNLELEPRIRDVFEADVDIREKTKRLSVMCGVPIEPGRTLLFIDEIQASQAAIHSLWAFRERMPDLHVVAAGSLLEFALRKSTSFGVGRIRSLFMHPLSFDEFLGARSHGDWLEMKKEATPENPLFPELHKQLVDEFRSYLLVGGMPEAVAAWVANGDYLSAQRIHEDIVQTYYDDFSKYSGAVEVSDLRGILSSAAVQIGSKFVYAKSETGLRAEKVKAALQLLVDAGLLIPVTHTAANGIPLGAETNEKFVKYIMLDSALLLRILSLENGGNQASREIVSATSADLVNKGGLAEMVAGLELMKSADPWMRRGLYYWQNLSRSANAEVDYVMAKDSKVLPIEVKSGSKGSMKSLRYMMSLKGIDKAIRTSLENFSRIDNIDIIPLYALSSFLG